MNIKEAKEEIKKAVTIYLDKDEYGEYTIPVQRQRPVFMVGAPGIGKTAIMEQIASELDLALVSYSMTHHTRQSALGLPVIETKEYGGMQVSVSEYTMSEIIASIYQVMEASGKKEGILFLDEINCVSETLAPAMLLFLQYKVFGNRQIPQGWVVVTAGNPPQYNKSVKEFDVATMDRLRRLDITEDFGVWKQYAYHQGIHPAVISFLESNREWFYSIQASVDGTRYVTARGWEDLSTAMQIYEKKEFDVDKRLIGQYLADDEIARKFNVYYQLYRKYRSDYKIEDILDGVIADEILQRAQNARMDERFSIVGLLLGRLNEEFRESMSKDRGLHKVSEALREANKSLPAVMAKEAKPDELYAQGDVQWKNGCYALALLAEEDALQKHMEEQAAANSLSAHQKKETVFAVQLLEEYVQNVKGDSAMRDWHDEGKEDGTEEKAREKAEEKTEAPVLIKKKFNQLMKQHKKDAKQQSVRLDNAFAFIERAWGNGQEMVLFVTELTAGEDSLEFIGKWGSDVYYRCNKGLLTYDVREELRQQAHQIQLL